MDNTELSKNLSDVLNFYKNACVFDKNTGALTLKPDYPIVRFTGTNLPRKMKKAWNKLFSSNSNNSNREIFKLIN